MGPLPNITSRLVHPKTQKIFKALIVVFVVAYQLIGIFPLTRFETDSMAVANACEEMMQSGIYEENVLGHSYHMQSGTYFIIIQVAELTGMSAFVSYSLITIFFALMYWLFLFLLLRKITNSPVVLIILILFLFQEIFMLSYYANSAVIASAFWMMSFYLLWSKNNNLSFIISALLLSLAAWFRVDVAFTFPSVLILFYMKDKNLKAALTKSLLLAVIVVPVTFLLMYSMNANVSGFIGYTEYHGNLFGTSHKIGILDLFVIKAHIVYFSVLSLFLILVSIIILLRLKNFLPVIFLISGILFYYLLGINNAIAPKHLSYYTLFWSVLILFGLNSLKQLKLPTRKIVIAISIFLFTIQYIIGFRVEISSVPYQFAKYATLNPSPTLLSLGNINLENHSFRNAEIVVGTGTKISTPDEIAASSGILYTPLMWYNQKKYLNNSFNKLSSLILRNKNDTLTIVIAGGSSQFVINNLLSNGFVWEEKLIDFDSKIQHLTFSKHGSSIVKLERYSVNKNNFKTFIEYFESSNNQNCYLVFIWDWQNYFLEKMNISYIKNITYHIHRLIEAPAI